MRFGGCTRLTFLSDTEGTEILVGTDGEVSASSPITVSRVDTIFAPSTDHNSLP